MKKMCFKRQNANSVDYKSMHEQMEKILCQIQLNEADYLSLDWTGSPQPMTITGKSYGASYTFETGRDLLMSFNVDGDPTSRDHRDFGYQATVVAGIQY